MAVPKDFQVGDTVLVERSGRGVRKSKNWNNSWTSGMDKSVGKCQVIRNVSEHGIRLDDDYEYPPSVLRLIKRGDTAYFRQGDKVIVARRSEKFVGWNCNGGMEGTLGKVYEVPYQLYSYQRDIKLDTETGQWWYGIDCLELYTDEMPQPKASASVPVFTIKDEPLQPWEKF